MNAGDGGRGPRSLEELEAALEAPSVGLDDLGHANPKRRRAALDRVRALDRRSPALARPLLERLEVEDNAFVLSRALSVCGAVCPGGEGCAAGAAVARSLAHADARVVANAIEALAALGDRAHAGVVTPLVGHAAPRVRANAIVYLSGSAGFDARAALAQLLAARDAGTLRSALWAVERLAPENAVELIRPAARSRDPEVLARVHDLARGLAARGDGAAAALVAALDGESLAERLELRPAPLAKRALAWLADSVFLGALAFGALWIVNPTTPPGPATEQAWRVRAQLVMLAYSLVFFMRDGLSGGRGIFKRWYGLRVVDLELSSGCGLVKSMIRQATFYLPLLNVCEVAWAAMDPDHCRIVDRLLGTMVVDEKERPLSRADRANLAFLGFAFVAGTIAVFVWATAGRLGFVQSGVTW